MRLLLTLILLISISLVVYAKTGHVVSKERPVKIRQNVVLESYSDKWVKFYPGDITANILAENVDYIDWVHDDWRTLHLEILDAKARASVNARATINARFDKINEMKFDAYERMKESWPTLSYGIVCSYLSGEAIVSVNMGTLKNIACAATYNMRKNYINAQDKIADIENVNW